MIRTWWKYVFGGLAVLCALTAGYMLADLKFGSVSYSNESVVETAVEATSSTTPVSSELVIAPKPTNESVGNSVWPQPLNTKEYDERMLALVDYVPPRPIVVRSTTTNASGTVVTNISTTTSVSPLQYSSSTNVTISGEKWPAAAVYPQGGAVLPFKRIVAYYGNFYSRRMGILGEFEPAEVLARLKEEQEKWEAVDLTTPVLPAIEYIVMVAQADAGADGMYRAVMPDAEVEKAYEMAKEIDGILILDIQVGLSTLEREMPKFKKYLERPEVHFALDPEFSMKNGQPPGTVIGTFDASDINYVIDYMSEIVREKQLPPKVLLVHRFTQNMVTRAEAIEPTPEVQVVMVMDGWGPKSLKRGTYAHIIEPEPVQFTGLKVFYKNDLKPPSTGLLTPEEIMTLYPKPIYIQYQ